MTRCVLVFSLLAALPCRSRADAYHPEKEAQRARMLLQGAAKQQPAAAQQPLREAFHVCDVLLKHTHETAGVRRVMGTCELLLGNLPFALQHFRRAVQLDPDDDGARRALEYARSQVAYASEEDRAALAPRPEEYPRLKRLLRQWGLPAAALANVLAWAALARWVVTRRPRWLVGFAIGLAVAGAVGAGWLIERHLRQEADAATVHIVTRPEILRRGNGPHFLPRRDNPLPAGAEVRTLGERNGWLQVELADGTIGWLPASAFGAGR